MIYRHDPPNFSPACDIGLKNNEDAAETDSCDTATIPSYYFTILSAYYHHTTSSYDENLLFQHTFIKDNLNPALRLSTRKKNRRRNSEFPK